MKKKEVPKVQLQPTVNITKSDVLKYTLIKDYG